MNNKQLPRDVFLYLLAVLTLGMVSVNFGTLLFQLVNTYVPDILTDRYTHGQYAGSIRWAVATLVIVFPVFFWVTRFLKKDIEKNPEKRDLKIRRWLLYLTLFVAGVVIIGDLVALVYNFLEGELTLRFSLKIAVILLIASAVFYYYLNELRDMARNLKTLTWMVIVLVIAAAISGIMVAGLPQSQRLKRIDEQRIFNLQDIQGHIIAYWQSKNKLPANPDDLRDDISGFIPPTDPQTDQTYEYAVLKPLSFRLCAVFETSNREDMLPLAVGFREPKQALPYPAYEETVWTHDKGRACFERTIDPERYKLQPVPLR